MKQVSVFEGNELKNLPPALEGHGARCFLLGTSSDGKELHIPLSDDLLSKHILFLGSIGTGKTNGIFQIVSQLRNRISSNDVMIIFDTKGDFYDTFYRKGDIVIATMKKQQVLMEQITGTFSMR
jgi:hypothetical protein